MDRKTILTLTVAVVLAFTAGFSVGQPGSQEDAEPGSQDQEAVKDEDIDRPVFKRLLGADVITNKSGHTIAMNSTNEILRNQTLLQNVLDEAVKNPNRSEDDGERYDASTEVSKEVDENVSEVLKRVPHYHKPIEGYYIRHEGEIVAVGFSRFKLQASKEPGSNPSLDGTEASNQKTQQKYRLPYTSVTKKYS